MGSKKPRIATYTDQNIIDEFKKIAELHNMSMSQYLEVIIKREISYYPVMDPEGNVTLRETYLLHNLIFFTLLHNICYFIRLQQAYIINKKKNIYFHLSHVTHPLT